MLYYTRDMKRIMKSTGTGGGAIQVFAALGITRLLMVGFDAFDDPLGPEYGKSFGPLPYREGSGPPTEPRWRKVNNHIRAMAELYSAEMTFWHRDMAGIREQRLKTHTPESAS